MIDGPGSCGQALVNQLETVNSSNSAPIPQKKRRQKAAELSARIGRLMQEEDDAMSWEENDGEEFEYRRKEIPWLRTKPPGKISREKMREVFMNNPKISRKATTEEYIRMTLSEAAALIEPVINKDLEPLDMSDLKQMMHAQELFQEYLTTYVPVMDERFKYFLSITFSSWQEAVLVFNCAVRSYVCGFCVHQMGTYKSARRGKIRLVQCHTRGHKKAESNENFCGWAAHIEYNDNSAKFTKIGSFSQHKFSCFRSFARLTSDEVSLRCGIPSNHLNGVMKRFGQCSRGKYAIYKRKSRSCAAVEGQLDQNFWEMLEKQEISESVSNRNEIDAESDMEVTLILKYLSYLQKEQQMEVYATIGKTDAMIENQVSSINLMWKEGKALLRTHHDVIFCDSMWNVSLNSYYVLTIVVVDENYDIRLAALSLTREERKDSWKSFFEWVKKKQPAFNPKCVVTDGALYIDDGFRDAIGNKAEHIVCWWHQRENVLKKIGINRDVGRIFLKIALANTRRERQRLKEDLKRIADANVEIASSANYQKMYKNCSRTALISLNVFTAGTITNSYSESMNSLLRRAGCDTKHRLITVLRRIETFLSDHNNRVKHRFKPTAELLSVISDEIIDKVTPGALCRFKNRVQKSIGCCRICKKTGNLVMVRERVLIRFQVRVGWNRHFHRQCRRRLKYVSHVVCWSNGIPKCSCNTLVYGGVPCAHIVACALAEQRKIPVECFNPRFYYESTSATEDESNELPMIDTETDERMARVIEEEEIEEESCAEVKEYSVCKLMLENADEIDLYNSLYLSYKDLVELYSLPEWKLKAKEIEECFSQCSTGLVVGCLSSAPSVVPSNKEETRIFNEICLNPHTGAVRLTRIAHDLHIADASMDSTYPSDEICEFRGKLIATMIKLIVVHRVNPGMEIYFVSLFRQKVEDLKELVQKSCSTQPTRSITLKKVCGNLRSDSFISVPDCVRSHCKTSLIDASNEGARLSLLLDAYDTESVSKRINKRRSKKKSKSSRSASSAITPRERRKNSRILFL